MNDEFWKQVRKLRDTNLNRAHAKAQEGLAGYWAEAESTGRTCERICRLAGRPLPEWRATEAKP